MWDTRSTTEVLAGLASCTLALQEDGVLSGWRQQSQLIESQDLAAVLDDPLASALSDTESTDAQLGDLQQAQIVGDGSDDDGNCVLACLALLGQTLNALK